MQALWSAYLKCLHHIRVRLLNMLADLTGATKLKCRQFQPAKQMRHINTYTTCITKNIKYFFQHTWNFEKFILSKGAPTCMHQFVTRSSLKFLTGIILSQSTVSLSTSLLLTGPPNHVHVCVIFTVWFVSLGVSIVGLSGMQFNLYPFTNVTTTIRVRRKRMYIWKSISCEKFQFWISWNFDSIHRSGIWKLLEFLSSIEWSRLLLRT